MPTFYNFRQNGVDYSFDDVFVPADLFRSGNVWGWGQNTANQLGTNNTDQANTPVTTFAGGNNWKQISGGRFWGTGIKTDGTLWTWGSGSGGRLGTNDTTSRPTPVTTFAGGSDWRKVSATGITAAIKTDGTLWTWGEQWNGGLGRYENVTIHVTTFGDTDDWANTSTEDPEELFTITCSRNRSSYAIKNDGTLWVWGRNYAGELGINESDPTDANFKSTPVTTFAGGTNWKQVSAGNFYTAAIKTDGTLWTWGSGTIGQLGNAQTTNRSTPITTFAGGTNWKQVSAGTFHTAAIKTDGTLWTWGPGANGRLGTNDTSQRNTPVTTFAGGTNWKQVSSGIFQTAAIKTDGTLWTWGDGSFLVLGTNDTTDRSTPVTTFAGGTDWKQVSAGVLHVAAIKTDGTLWTWGGGADGQLGTNDTTNRSTPVTTFAGGTNWKQVSAGVIQTAAIKTDGTLWTWGGGRDGALGTDNAISSLTPVTTFLGGNNWIQVNMGFHSIALRGDGTNNQLFLSGSSSFGEIGNGAVTVARSIPAEVFGGGTNWKDVSVGRDHSVAIKTDGTLWTWGYNTSESLGINATNKSITPVTTFAGGSDWKQASAGEFYTAAIKTDRTLWTWGDNSTGQLGRIELPAAILTPVTTFAGGTNWADTPTTEPEDLYTLSAGASFSAAIKTDGTLWTWGLGTFGRLGINDTTDRSTPVTTFAGGTDWKQVSAGGFHVAAIKTDGTLWTWGSGANGRLGTNDTSQRDTPVTTFAGGTDWKQVSSGIFQTAAIKTDGTLWTWGPGVNGRLGTNDTSQRNTPVTTFAGGTNWKLVSVGNGHMAAIKTDGTLWTWGAGADGRLGTNDETDRLTPVTTFAGGTNWKQVSNESISTAAIKTDGTLWTWGPGANGRLGTNDTSQRNTPVTTFAGGTNWKQVSAGNVHTAAIKTNGTLWTWGAGQDGRLGTNNTSQRNTPVTTFAGGTNWKQVTALDHTLAIRDNDGNQELFGFGRNNSFQLGIGGNPINIPNQISPDENWKQVVSARGHTAAIKTDGTLWTWGLGSSGQLGTNDTTNRSTPVTTFAGGTNWKQVNAGGWFVSTIKTDGTLWNWGFNGAARLGVGDLTNRSTPVTTFTGGTNWKQAGGGYQFGIALTYEDPIL